MLRKQKISLNLFLRRSSFPHAQFASYDHKAIQSKWQDVWDKTNVPTSERLDDTSKEKYYCLSQFPYPSGNLHMGHARVYFITDTISKFEGLKGKAVFTPMGWDAFGLPAENAALDRDIQPSVWTYKNIQETKRDLIKIGVEFDWDHEIATCHPGYYKWTQWIFTQMFKNNIVTKKPSIVNWDPVDQTVLANEQIDENGRSWRSEAIVEKKQLDQWFFSITDFAKKLSNDLEILPDWPDTVKEMQKGWIGYSEGANLHFDVFDSENKNVITNGIEVYTTRLDTLYGCTFLAMSYEHPLAQKVATATEKEAIQKKVEDLAKLDELTKKKLGKQKEGLLLSRIHAIHPLTKKQIPVYLTNYVLAGYGTGAVMGVPAHDERDQEFAELHNLEIVDVLEPICKRGFEAGYLNFTVDGSGQVQGHKLKNSEKFNGLSPAEATKQMVEVLKGQNKGEVATNYSIRDWSVSRQRYWGVPIPMIHCNSCGWVAEEDKNLPLELPKSLNNLSDLRHVSPLSKIKDFVETDCPKCKSKATREFDTMDTFVDSSWYYLRFLDPRNEQEFCRRDLMERWLPVDVYIGGIEHAILHLLYARFVHKALYDIGAIPKHPEPFKQLITQGMVKGKTYRLKTNGKYLFPQERAQYSQDEVNVQYDKMSKSKGNGVHPIEVVDQYGSDCLRMAMFFYGPIEKDVYWDDALLKTIEGFLDKLTGLSGRVVEEVKKASGELDKVDLKEYFNGLNKAENEKKKAFLVGALDILDSLESSLNRKERHLHVAVARVMETINYLHENREEFSKYPVEAFFVMRTLLINAFPLAPFLTSELWESFKGLESVIDKNENKYFGDVSSLLKQQIIFSPKEMRAMIKSSEEDAVMDIFVNGKGKGTLKVPLKVLENESELQKFVLGQDIKGLEKGIQKLIRPKGKNLINLIAK